MQRAWVVGMLGVLGCLAAGCGISKDRQSAETVADEYLTAVANQDLDKAISLWDSRGFQQGITEKEWRKVLSSLPNKLGDMRGHKMVGWRIEKRAMTSMTGTFCALNYQVTYAKYPSQETVTLFRPVRGDHFLVVGHNINCKGLVL
jgi:hypothetical protein